jgi:CMP-N,N'-diacetyllegionaminic acid synthase
MIEGKTVLAVIPARGGSKGIPRKNIRDLCGKPLIAWTIEEAKKSKYIDRLILSSEDLEIIEVAKEWGCDVPFVRPTELAQDQTPGIDPVLHAIEQLPPYQYIVLLQPTSPLRSVGDIDGCIEQCVSNKVSSCVSVTEADRSPYWMYLLDEKNRMRPLLDSRQTINRRQELPAIFALNGAVYVAKSDCLTVSRTFVTADAVAYQMPKERSVDIDTEMDLAYVKAMITKCP